jgi:hypothetical protein
MILLGAVVYIRVVCVEEAAHIHLSAYEGVHIHFPDVVILLGAVVYIQIVCVERAKGAAHSHLFAYEGVHI